MLASITQDRPTQDAPADHLDGKPRLALVTGATGFTGGHLAVRLRQRGDRVRALVRDPARARHLTEHGIELVRGDLTDPATVARAAAGCTHIYHIAALYRSAKHPPSMYHRVNVDGTRYVLDAAEQHRVRRVVHCSTAGVHGELSEIPGDENSPFNPDDIYQETKLKGELLAREAFQGGLPGTTFRPVGIYGPGDTRFLKLFRAIHRGRFRMIGPGTARYHLTYIDDLVDGIVLCGEEPRALGRTYILAGPHYTTVQELAEQVAAAVGRPLPAGHIPMLPVMSVAVCCEMLCRGLRIEPPLHRRRLDFFHKDRAFTSARAERELGYAARHDLADGLERTARWYFQNNYLRGPLPATVPG